MVFFNWATMQMAAKIVYYGPGLCGKTTNLSYIYAKTSPASRGEMVSLETESDRTLFFDLLPIEVGTIGGFKTRLQLYTVPGQVFYNTTRKLVLKGVDGIVFVADSQRPMREANIESLDNLRENLEELGLDMDEIPLVLQYNKRDLKNVLTVEELNSDLNPEGAYPFFEASAIQGDGVFETLKEITKLTLKKLRKRMSASQQESRAVPAAATPAAAPVVRPKAPAATPAAPKATVSAAALARAAEEGVGELDAQEPVEPPMPVEEPRPEPPQEAPAPPEPEAPTLRMARPAEAPEGAGEAEAAEEPEAEEIEELEEAEEIEEIEEVEEPAPAGEEMPAAAESAGIPGEEGEAAVAAEPEAGPEEEAAEEPAVEFATEERPVEPVPPPVKRVHVDSQMDILAELDNLRKQATMSGGGFGRSSAAEVDLDSLLGQELNAKKEVRRRLAHQLNSDIFRRMRTVQLAVRIQDEHGETITTLDPMSVAVEGAASLRQLLLTLTLDLEKNR